MGRKNEMREVFARWRESGQSLRAFSRREGIAYAKLMYWRRKFRQEEGPAAEDRGKRAAGERRGLVPVRVVPDEPASSGEAWFEIRTGNGHALRVPPGCDEGELRRLVLVLASC
jgi:transposase-like protein